MNTFVSSNFKIFFYFKKHGYKFIKGKKDGPYATLNGALDNIRTLRRSNKSYQHVFIFLRGGNYRIFEQTIIKVNVFFYLFLKKYFSKIRFVHYFYSN